MRDFLKGFELNIKSVHLLTYLKDCLFVTVTLLLEKVKGEGRQPFSGTRNKVTNLLSSVINHIPMIQRFMKHHQASPAAIEQHQVFPYQESYQVLTLPSITINQSINFV